MWMEPMKRVCRATRTEHQLGILLNSHLDDLHKLDILPGGTAEAEVVAAVVEVVELRNHSELRIAVAAEVEIRVPPYIVQLADRQVAKGVNSPMVAAAVLLLVVSIDTHIHVVGRAGEAVEEGEHHHHHPDLDHLPYDVHLLDVQRYSRMPHS